MRKREILRNNKLIAQFMGHYKKGEGILHFKEGFSNPYVTNNVEDIKYHSSWDWLMPVVIKIAQTGFLIGKEEKSIINALRTISILYNYVQDREAISYPLLNKEDVYKGVVEYIKWLNRSINK